MRPKGSGGRHAAKGARRRPRTPDGHWRDAVAQFLAWKRSETSVGDDWLRRMRWELLRFPTLVSRASPGASLDGAAEVSAEHVAALRRAMTWEKATFALHFAAVRQFLSWAGNPLGARRSVWSLPSGVSTHRRWLTRVQFRRLFQGSTGRGRLLVGLEGLNGLRRVEVLRLRVQDVTLDQGTLRVLGKGRDGGKWRIIPIHEAVRPLLASRVRGCPATERIFPVSRTGVDHVLHRAAAESGLVREGIPVSHHDLRRTFGRLAHDAGMDLVQLKNLYGHQSLEQTVHYIGLDSDRMREGIRRIRLEGSDRRRAVPTLE